MKRKTVLLGALLISLIVATPAWASIFKVGTGAGCTHSTIQAAVNAANANPGVDHILISRSQAYTAQAISMTAAQPLTISGGYATCASPTPSGVRTVISGAGGAADSVFSVLTGNADILFENVQISDGDEGELYHGGGINYSGSGSLTLQNMIINNNSAGYGGGLSADGGSGAADVLIMGNVSIANNTALRNGGGVYLAGGVTLYMLENSSAIFSNSSSGAAVDYGYGGGLCVVAPAQALISEGGFGAGLGVISFNQARRGGGIAALAEDDVDGYAVVTLYSDDPANPLLLNDNSATMAGGAIYTNANRSITIFGSNGTGAVYLRSTNVIANWAPIGAVAYLSSDSSLNQVRSGGFGFTGNAPACAAGVTCNRIADNIARNEAGQATNGALIYGTDEANFSIHRAHVTGNVARSFLDLTSALNIKVANTLIEGNTFSAAVFQFPEDEPEIDLNHLTITGNSIGGPGVIAHRGNLRLNRSIVWQPGKTVRDTAASSGTFTGAYLLANETTTTSTIVNVFYPYDPAFMNPTHADYRLRAGSHGLDAAPPNADLDGSIDLDGLDRVRDLPLVLPGGTVDLGAYERQSIGNIMVNDLFDTDLSQWTQTMPAVVSHDSDNGAGATGSGSLKVNHQTAAPATLSATFASQCQIIPGPGLYRLTGLGKSPGSNLFLSRNKLRLHWKRYRPNFPANACTGQLVGEGDVVIPPQLDVSVDTRLVVVSASGLDPAFIGRGFVGRRRRRQSVGTKPALADRFLRRHYAGSDRRRDLQAWL